MTISFIIPSINRPSLHDTIKSIELRQGDEVIVEFDLPPTGYWGNLQRTRGMRRAKGDYLAFIDDDNVYVPNHREIMEQAIRDNPGLPNLFRIKYPNGDVLWKDRRIYPGNVSTQMIFIPNKQEMLVDWNVRRNMADYMFISNWKWSRKLTIWREEIIALNNPPHYGTV